MIQYRIDYLSILNLSIIRYNLKVEISSTNEQYVWNINQPVWQIF